MTDNTTTREPRKFDLGTLSVAYVEDVQFAASGGGGGDKSSPFDPIGEAAMKLKSGQVLKVPVPENRTIGSFRLATANSINKRFGDALKEERGDTAMFRVRRSKDGTFIGVYIGFKGDGDETDEVEDTDTDEVEDEDWEDS